MLKTTRTESNGVHQPKIIVLASNSFSGASFVDYALNQEAQVVGISRSQEPSAIFLPYKRNSQLENFQFVQGDLNQDMDQIFSILHEFKPDYVVDFASQGMVAPSWTYPHQWYTTNIVAKVKLHDRLRTLPFIKRYVRISTPEVYGSTEGHVKENTVLNPSTPYAVSHAAIDMSLKAFYNNYQFPVVSTRSSNVFGAHQQLYRIIPRAIICAILGKKLKLDGGGYSIRNFIDIRDISSAIWITMTQSMPGEIYHVATDEYISIRDLVSKICSQLKVHFDAVVEIAEDRPGKDKAYYLDTAKIQTQLGWKPCVSLDEGIRSTIEWVEKNIEIIRGLPLEYIHKE